jgi:hypothetical protein
MALTRLRHRCTRRHADQCRAGDVVPKRPPLPRGDIDVAALEPTAAWTGAEHACPGDPPAPLLCLQTALLAGASDRVVALSSSDRRIGPPRPPEPKILNLDECCFEYRRMTTTVNPVQGWPYWEASS